MEKQVKNFLSVKPVEAYSSDVIDSVRLVSYRTDSDGLTHLAGSFTFRSQKYPGDIDGINKVNTVKVDSEWKKAESPITLAKNVAKRLQEIVKDILAEKESFFVELKAGYDYKVLDYLWPMGTMSYGTLKLDPTFKDRVKKLPEVFPKIKNSKLLMEICHDLLDKWIPLVDNDPQGAYANITKLCRDLFVLRWTAVEIEKGLIEDKFLVSDTFEGKGISLEESLLNPVNHVDLTLPIVKIDIIKYIDGFYMDVSNIYLLEWMNEGKVIKHMSAYPEVEGLALDVEKLAFSSQEGSLFKCLKRMYAYGRYRTLSGVSNDFNVYSKITVAIGEFLASDISLIYQAKSRLQCILDLYKIIPKGNALMNAQIDLTKNTLSNSLVLSPEEVREISDNIDIILSKNGKVRMELLKLCITQLSYVCDDVAYRWLRDNNMDPIPSIFLASKKGVDLMNKEKARFNIMCAKQSYRTYDDSKNLL